jgi:hypothetical protein
MKKLDRHMRDFFTFHSDGVVVHVACGLDARFERVDNARIVIPETIGNALFAWLCLDHHFHLL